MDKKAILDKVYTRTYYIGESRKRENIDASIIQACEDNSDILEDYFKSALNELNFYSQKRLVQVVMNEETIEVTSERVKNEELKECLENLVSDYLAEYVLFRWLSDNGYGISPEGVSNALENVKDCICALAPKVIRRAANMGI